MVLVAVLVINVVHLALTDDDMPTDLKRLPVNLTFLVVVEYLNDTLAAIGSKIELSLSDLLLWRHVGLQFEFLRHLFHVMSYDFAVLLVFDALMVLRLLVLDLGVVRN